MLRSEQAESTGLRETLAEELGAARKDLDAARATGGAVSELSQELKEARAHAANVEADICEAEARQEADLAEKLAEEQQTWDRKKKGLERSFALREQDIAESIEPLREECARFEAQCHLEESAASELQSQHAAVASELAAAAEKARAETGALEQRLESERSALEAARA